MTEETTKVVNLRGEPVGQVNEDTVVLLERLLAEAKAGDLRSIVYGTVYRDRAIRTGYEGEGAQTVEMVAASALAHHRMAQRSLENSRG